MYVYLSACTCICNKHLYVSSICVYQYVLLYEYANVFIDDYMYDFVRACMYLCAY